MAPQAAKPGAQAAKLLDTGQSKQKRLITSSQQAPPADPL